MRIEVLVGNDDPVIFPLNSGKIVVGSSENCDVVLETNGVSRKHITIISEDDRFFIVDMGSTNGSFINEERLIPGKKVEFTSFFPVRLGSDVLVSLISDDEHDLSIDIPASFKEKSSPAIKVPKEEEDKTSVISLADLNKVKTDTLVKNRNLKRNAIKKKASKGATQKPKKERSFLPTLGILLVVAAGVYNYRNREIVETIPDAKIGQLIKKEPPEQVEEKSEFLIADSDLINKEAFIKLTNTLKCTTDVEKYLCTFFPGANSEPFGVVQVGLTQHVLINGNQYFDEARKLVKAPIDNSPVSLEEFNKLVLDTGVYLYLLRMNHDLDQEMLKDMNLAIAFFKENNGNLEVGRVLAIKPEVFPLLKEFVREDNLRFIKSNGRSALKLAADYYITY